MKNEFFKVINDFRKGKIDLTYIENNKDLLASHLKFLFTGECISDFDIEEILTISEGIIFSLILGLKKTRNLSIEPFLPTSEEYSEEYGDFMTEILPECLLVLDNYNYDFLTKLLLAENDVEEPFLYKSPIFYKFFRECYLDNNMDYFISFVEKNKDKNLYDFFVNDIVNCFTLYDPIKAGKYVDYFESRGVLSGLDGQFYENKLSALSKCPIDESILYSREQIIDVVLYRLQNNFGYKLYKEGKIFKVKYPKENYDFYNKLDRVEKNISEILNNNSGKGVEELVENILNIDVTDIVGLDTDYLFTKFDRYFFIVNVLDDFMCQDIPVAQDELSKIVADNVVEETLWTFMETIEKAQMSIKEYDEMQKVFPSCVIEEFAEDFGREGFFDELDIPLDDNPNVKA